MAKIFLAKPRGFCAGVKRAIKTVEQLIKTGIKPVYVRHEIVHNRHVVEDLKKNGVVFVENLSKVPKGSHLIFNAHGVSAKVEREAKEKGLLITDATCPIVKKIHTLAELYSSQGRTIILIGSAKHPEIIGTAGRINGKYYIVEKLSDIHKIRSKKGEEFVCLTQTTLNLDECRKLFEALKKKLGSALLPGKDNICYATVERQNAVKDLAKKADLIFIIGSKNSSNSRRLKELAEKCGAKSYLIEDENDIKAHMLAGFKAIGISSGASAPEYLVRRCIKKIKKLQTKISREILADKKNSPHREY